MTARLGFETPARLSLAALERLTLRAVFMAHNTMARLYNDLSVTTTPAKTTLSTNFVGAGHNPVNSEERAFLLKRSACLASGGANG